MTPGLLLVQADAPYGTVAEGAVVARYEALDGDPRHLTCVFGANLHAMSAAGALDVARYPCDEISDTGDAGRDPRALSVVAFDVPDVDEAQFEDWYQGEHVGLLMRVPGWLRVRRYRVRPERSQGPRWTHLALHELAGVEVMNRPERAAARATARRDALADRPWFARGGRWLYRPADRATAR
jgi:hypothetical protein